MRVPVVTFGGLIRLENGLIFLFCDTHLPEWLLVQNDQSKKTTSSCFDSEGLTPNSNDSTDIIIVAIGTFWHDVTPPTQERQKHHWKWGHVRYGANSHMLWFYVLLCIPGSSDPPSTLQESPTRFPPTRPKSKAKDPTGREKDIKSKTGMKAKIKYCLGNMYRCTSRVSIVQSLQLRDHNYIFVCYTL